MEASPAGSLTDVPTKQQAHKAKVLLLGRARDARQSPAAFFEYVMREEKTQRPIRIVPHQRVLLDFEAQHDRAVVLLPVDHTKSFCSVGMVLYLLGQDPTMRGAVVSATQTQSEKLVGMARDYVDIGGALGLVYPELRRSRREGDPWTQGRLVVDRPPGIKDPSLQAVGLDTKSVTGSRLDWVVVDDILNLENTGTQDQRKKTVEWFFTHILSRVMVKGGKVLVTNTAFHPEDLLHVLANQGWPTIRMDVYGDVEVRNTDWDSEHLRPARPDSYECRLTEHDPDPQNAVPLWPERYSVEAIENIRKRYLPHRFNQLYRNICRDDDTARCKVEWIDECKRLAQQAEHFGLVSNYRGANLTFTGVDLAVSPGEEHDDTAFFTFELLPNGKRKILDIEIGQYPGPVTVRKIIQKQAAYNSIVRVENNGSQEFIRQFALEQDASLPIKAHTTGRAKAHPEHGVEGLFVELSNGAWLIPTDRHGNCHPHVQKWIDDCLYYQPTHHSPDSLMACVAPGAITMTRRGPIAIEHVRVGDEVLTHKGRWRKVAETMVRHHIGPALTIKPTGMPAFTLTPEHPVWASGAKHDCIRRTNRVIPKGDWSFRRADEIRQGPLAQGDFFFVPQASAPIDPYFHDLAEYVIMRKLKWGARWQVSAKSVTWSGTKKRIPRWPEVDGDLAVLIGLYLAEGSIGGKRHVVTFALHSRELHLRRFICRTMKRYFAAKSRTRDGTGRGVVVSSWSNLAARFFSEFGKGETKGVPWDIWHVLPQSARMKIARGWLMGDGCYTVIYGRARVSGVSISRTILAQVQQAFVGAGHLPTMGTFLKAGPRPFDGKPSTCRNSWRIVLSQRDTHALLDRMSDLERKHWGSFGTSEKRKGVTDRTNTRLLRTDGGFLTRATKIEKVQYDGPVYNMHVEEDESYTVEGVAVHNCYFSREQAREFGVLRGMPDGGGNQGSIAMSVLSR